MQNRDGGWAAFDVDIDNQVLTKVPFADHNAMLDPSCADITARVLEVLGHLGYRADHPAIARALDYLWATQEPEGCWYGRWGVNYIYGTWQVLLGPEGHRLPDGPPGGRRAADWLESVQQASGGWGESCLSYDDPSWMGRGEPTASQTAWAVLGLIAAGRADGEAVRAGHPVPARHPECRRHLGRDQLHGNRIPSRLLSQISPLPDLFPADGRLARYQAAVGRLGRASTRRPGHPHPGPARAIEL